jgi:Zn-finger nucleic acid-binding protein
MEWVKDRTFGPEAESARCPRCGGVWGVRERRRPAVARRKAVYGRSEPEPRPRPVAGAGP